jgi:hypothetical protein
MSEHRDASLCYGNSTTSSEHGRSLIGHLAVNCRRPKKPTVLDLPSLLLQLPRPRLVDWLERIIEYYWAGVWTGINQVS